MLVVNLSSQFSIHLLLKITDFDKASSRVIHNTIIQRSNLPLAEGDASETPKIDFTKPPYMRIDFLESLQSAIGKTLPSPVELQNEFVEQQSSDIRSFLQDLCQQNDVNIASATSLAKLLDKLFGHFVERSLTEPTFVLDHPICMSPLAKEHRTKPGQ